MRLVLVISSLAGGGAERAMAALANAWVAQGASVALITLALRSEDSYALRPEVLRIDLGLLGDSTHLIGSLFASMRRVRALRRAISECRADVVISFMTTTNLLVLMAAAGLRVPVIVSERTFVGMHPPRGISRGLHRLLYRRAAAVVAQTRRGATDLQARVARPVHVIPNWVTRRIDDPSPGAGGLQREGIQREPGDRVVLAAGRLDPPKGFDLLIDAFARVAARHPLWRLVILGEGPARADLAVLIEARGMQTRVSMPGFTPTPRAVMREADLFVLSSRYEGMPNALIEAMSEGLACVSFDCQTGPGELIDHGINGWLVPPEDTTALAGALEVLMADDSLRARLGTRAREVRETHSEQAILPLWSALLTEVIATARGAKSASTAPDARPGA
jgi:glycosyltransferase involved in cell wall biosynthesis